jgi:uncharacterized protein (DUF2147 family)
MYLPKKTFLFCLSILVCFALSIHVAKAQTDKIEGLWYNDVKTAKVAISKGSNGKFNGKIVWLKEPLEKGKPKVDENNPDANLKKRPLLGLQILSGFDKDEDNKYINGSIYDPKNGKTYSCKMTYKGKTLDIRGYIGISLLGRTTVWERAN